MAFQTLSEIRSEMATRLGFGSQPGAEIINGPIIDSFVQRAQSKILSEFGSAFPGTIYPPTPFIADDDPASVDDNVLITKALIPARTYYRQPADADVANWNQLELDMRGFAG